MNGAQAVRGFAAPAGGNGSAMDGTSASDGQRGVWECSTAASSAPDEGGDVFPGPSAAALGALDVAAETAGGGGAMPLDQRPSWWALDVAAHLVEAGRAGLALSISSNCRT